MCGGLPPVRASMAVLMVKVVCFTRVCILFLGNLLIQGSLPAAPAMRVAAPFLCVQARNATGRAPPG
jgi:hypothetical protein